MGVVNAKRVETAHPPIKSSEKSSMPNQGSGIPAAALL
jgi:hypothetical protein